MAAQWALLLGLLTLCGGPVPRREGDERRGAEAPSVLEKEILIPRTLPGEVPKKHLRVLDLAVGTDTLKTVEAKLGRGSAFRVGGDASSAREVCFRFEQGDMTAAVAFESGAMGGWEDVTAISVATVRALGTHAGSCSARLGAVREVSTEGGLKLGLTRAQVKALFTTGPVLENDEGLGYFYSSQDEKEGTRYWSGAYVGLRGDRVEWFRTYAFEEVDRP